MKENDIEKTLDAKGLAYLWKKIVDYVNGMVPSRTSQLVNDAGFITNFSEIPPEQRESLRGPQGVPGPQGDQGNPGETGKGISSIAKTSTSGLTDTYTITYTDGSSYQYVVKNGKDGADAASTGIDYSDINNTPHIPEALSELSEDSLHRTVTDSDKISWNSKSTFSGNYNDLSEAPDFKTINGESIIGTGDIVIQGGGGTQVQADWEQTDTTQPDYIKNKPDVYVKPSTGIPSTDLSSAVQTSLGKADNAVPTTRKVNGKALSSDVTLDASDVGALPDDTPIPVVPTNVSCYSNDTGEGIIPSDGIRAETVTSAATMSINPDVVTLIDGSVGTSSITLQVPNDNLAHVWDILMTTGASPAVTFSLSNSATILKPDGWTLEASKSVEISVIGKGTTYYLRYGEFA